MRESLIAAAMVSGLTSSVMAGPKPHEHSDVIVAPIAGQLTTNSEHDEMLELSRVFAGELGELAPNFGSEPGFASDTLPAFTQVGFNIMDSLRVWNGSDFGAISSGTMTIELAPGVPGTPSATTPTSPGIVNGFAFSTADSDGVMHQDLGMTLNAPAGAGVYLLQLRLIDTSGALNASAPFWFVLNNGADELEHDAAVKYVETVLVPTPGITAMFGVFTLAAWGRRR